MSRQRRGRMAAITMILGVCLVYREQAKLTLLAAAALIGILAIIKLHGVIPRRHLDVDTMSGLDFEHYVADVLADCGYVNIRLTERYDFGIDIVAEKDGIRWGIQVKRYNGLVKADAVRQAVTALPLYGCDKAMVITNSMFSHVAQRLAEGNNCVLIDRPELFRLAR